MKTVNEIMNKQVLTINLDTPFTVACRMFQSFGFRHLPVVDDKGRVCGMFSLSDAMSTLNSRIVNNDNLNEEKINNLISVQEVMTERDIQTLKRNDDMDAVLSIFSTSKVHSILVHENEKLIGIVTPTDIIRNVVLTECFT